MQNRLPRFLLCTIVLSSPVTKRNFPTSRRLCGLHSINMPFKPMHQDLSIHYSNSKLASYFCIPLINIFFLCMHVFLIFRNKVTSVGEVTHPNVDQLLIMQCLKLLVNINTIKPETCFEDDSLWSPTNINAFREIETRQNNLFLPDPTNKRIL